jgi:hypothetical protein
MLREVLIAACFVIASCTSVRRDKSADVEATAELASEAPSACAFKGIVIHDPHFHTIVRPPHGGTFVASLARVGDRVTARSTLGEIMWGPNRGKIITPVDGVVVHAGATIGSYLRDTDAPFVVADPRRLAVRVAGLPRNATSFDIAIEGLERFVGYGARHGAYTLIALPAGAPATVGAAASVSVECSS